MRAWMLFVTLGGTLAFAVSALETQGNPDAVALFNGVDFTGWKLFIPDEKTDPKTVWCVENGVIRCTGNPAGYLRTEKEFENYRLRLEWRWPKGAGNSGALLHISGPDKVWPKSIEAQLQSEHAGDFWAIDGTDFKEHVKKDERRVPKRGASSEKPLGEWNRCEIVCDGNGIQVFVNDVLQNAATETTAVKGFIGLQSEGTPIEFRNITLEPVVKK